MIELSYSLLLVVFYLLGTAEDFFWAMWTKKVNELSYQATLWSFLLASIRLIFIMGLIEYKDWGLGIAYVFGLMSGTLAMLRLYKRNLKQ